MGKYKDFSAAPSVRVNSEPNPLEPLDAVVHIGEHVSYHGTNIDFGSWLNLGIDDWVSTLSSLLRALHIEEARRNNTLITYGRQHAGILLDFLISTTPKISPAGFSLDDLDLLIENIADKPNLAVKTRQNYYSGIKSLLVELCGRGVCKLDVGLMPSAPFQPDGQPRGVAGKALSTKEALRVAQAITADVVAIHRGSFRGNAGNEALTIYVLALAKRLGPNTTPILELARDGMREHPLFPNMMVITMYKGRAKRNQITSIRGGVESAHISMDGVAIFNAAKAYTQQASQNSKYPGKLWVYRKRGLDEAGGEVVMLSAKELSRGIAAFVKRHGLKGDDGLPLRLTLSRLRKTKSNRLWRLSNGDLAAVSSAMNQVPAVTETHYLQVSEEQRRDHAIICEDLPSVYITIPLALETTPVGSCKDPLQGQFAPKNGSSSCADFLSCFSCRSYTVVGEPEDLHRLYSFYWFLDGERLRIGSSAWSTQFGDTMKKIDDLVYRNFPKSVVDTAKAKGREDPHPFWKNYSLDLFTSESSHVVQAM